MQGVVVHTFASGAWETEAGRALGCCFLFLLFYSYVYDCLTCMNVLHQVQCLQRLERARDPPWLELQLGVTVWVLGIEPGTSAKATGARNR